tara:strand:+ start:2523 stop:3020 length:498 start_codon:yes stop_codon:yes gene_type:complete
MSQTFLKATEVRQNAAGYVVATVGKEERPVNHPAWVQQQRNAEFVVKLAAATAGKNFKTGKTDDLASIIAQVRAGIANDTRTYVTAPAKPAQPTLDAMVAEQLAQAGYLTEKDTTGRINEVLNQYSAIADVENVGDYFQEGVVKLNAIYTFEQVKAATIATLGLL